MPSLDPTGSRQLGRLAAVGAAVVGVGLAGGRWAGVGAVTAAEAPAHELTLNSSATQSVRATLRQGGLDIADANGAAFALSDLMDSEHPTPGLDFDIKVERSDDGGALRLVEMRVRRQGQITATLTRAADGSLRLTRGAEAQPPPTASADVREAPTVLQGPMEDVLYGDPGTSSDAVTVLRAARLFAQKLDLTRDLALGDRVRLIFTRRVASDGRILGAGDLLYAEIDTHDGPTRFYRHRRADGEAEFVDQDGVSFDHALLRTPLDRPRITSDFGLRLHPLLGYTRMHQGLDFGAPIGSAVLAAGDGLVEEVRWASGYGRWIKLRHTGGLETGYGHLSAWAPGLRAGASVRQGQLIGYVGSSGLSTGPHLHYEVLQAGHPVDPKIVLSTGSATMKGADRAVFEVEKQKVASLLHGPSIAQSSGSGRGLSVGD